MNWEDQFILDSRTLSLCVSYEVNGEKYRDNNDTENFEIVFTLIGEPEDKVLSTNGEGAKSPNTKDASAQSTATEATNDIAECIQKAILQTFGKESALEDWYEKDPTSDDNDNVKWSKLPSKAQEVVRKIEADPSTYKWESLFIPLVVDLGNVEEGWSDIVLRPEVRDSIVQMVEQPASTGRANYGVLKRGRVGGALLYGPPGTGKTHQARVLTHESKSVMLNASAVDIQNIYVGGTEKAIKGLFSLARMLAPSIIFIDEAESLFHTRRSEDKNWERSQVNQMLQEIDRLTRVKTPPFVLLATNFPNQLDHAVLRRVPTRLHIGLPCMDDRAKILEIYLREEELHPGVDIRALAR